MNITHGMDVDEVEDLGRFLQQRAERLRQLTQEINRVVCSVPWEGGVAQQFAQQHWPAHRARLQAAVEQLHGLGRSAVNNASEQLSASGANPASGGRHATAGIGSPSGSWGALGVVSAALGGVVTLLGAPGDVSQASRLGRYISAQQALRHANGAERLAVAGRVGGLKTQLLAHNKLGKLGAVDAVLSTLHFGSSVKDHGLTDGQTVDEGVDAVGSFVAGRVTPLGGLAWSLGYDIIGPKASDGLDWVFEKATGDDFAGAMYNLPSNASSFWASRGELADGFVTGLRGIIR